MVTEIDAYLFALQNSLNIPFDYKVMIHSWDTETSSRL